jgi:molybdate transport system regulatory protein
MDADFDARLETDEVAFTDRDAALLRQIDTSGSLNRAADELGRSYSRAHKQVKALEVVFGPLVESQRGGQSGGGSTLTNRARELLAKFERLQAGYSSVAETSEAVLDGTVATRDGELGTVSTAVGTVKAIVPPNSDTVQVSIRADAVTLHDPQNSPPGDATSARNRFAGTVVEIRHGETVSHVTVDIGADEHLFALVTEASRERLNLAPGKDVVASFKATATRATAGQHIRPDLPENDSTADSGEAQ